MELRKRVVIIGGGFVGGYVAKKLESNFRVTLIDTKDYIEYTPGILRAIVNPEAAADTQVLHEHYLRKATVEIGEATRITHTHVLIGKKQVPYDYLVLSSGCSYNRPFRQQNVIAAERGHELRNNHEQLMAAKSVLVIGGGIVGVELAAEIADTYPEKTVTIVHSHDLLVHTLPIKATRLVTRHLLRHGVDIIYEDRVTKAHGKSFTLKSGKKLTADLAFQCVGNKPNIDYVGKELLDDRGFVNVDTNLRVPETTNLFAGGDIAGTNETKLAQNAQKHARIIVKNIRCTEREKRLKKYVPKPRPGIIDLGPIYNVFFYRNFTLGGRIPVLMKRILAWRWRRTFS